MRIKTTCRLVIAILPALLAAGCDKEMNTELPADAQVPVEIAGATIAAGVQTRTTSMITNGSIGVFRTDANGYLPEYNVQYTYKGGWSPDITALAVGNANATLCAYYPYNAASFAANSTTCTITAQPYDAGKDLCYATTGGTDVCNYTPSASFAMKRAYARLKLSITLTENYVGNCNVANVNIRNSSGNNFVTSRKLDISNGNYSGEVYTGDGWTNSLNPGNIAPGATNDKCDVLVPPQEIDGGLAITLLVDGEKRGVTVPAARFSNELGAGRQYTISLTITDVAVILNGNINIDDMVSDGTVIQNDNPVEI